MAARNPEPQRPESGRLELTLRSEREVVLTRWFEAPRALVYGAHTSAEHLRHWWGPQGYELSVCDLDVRPGGSWRMVQTAPDGSRHAFRGTYREITPPERLVYTFEYEGTPGHIVLMTLEFHEAHGRTRLTSTSLYESQADRDGMIEAGMEWGARQSGDRLDVHLAAVLAAEAAPASARDILFERVIDAPRALVFQAWTDPAHLVHWWGPRGFTTTIHAIDVRPGGMWRFLMHGPDGVDYPNQIHFEEVVPPERLVYSHSGGEDGKDAPFRTTITLAAEGDRTRLTMRMVFPSAEARDQVVEQHGAIEGGQQHLERLGEYLAKP